MLSTTFLEIPPAEPVQMRKSLRRPRYGDVLAFHISQLYQDPAITEAGERIAAEEQATIAA